MALAAISAMTITVSCDSEYEPSGYYSEVNVSNSYVSLSTSGGSATTDVYSASSWEIQNAPEWLTVSPLSGSAGQTTVTFSAESTLDGRTATLKLVSADKTQYINVIQGLAVISDATCAEIIAGPDSKTYRAKGICTAIANTNYGNWYLKDDTGEIYIYGTLDKSGKEQNFLSLGIEVGDEVTVEGPKTTYNGTVELVNVSVVKINKSLIKCDSVSADIFPVEGGEITAYLTNKGSNLSVIIPEDAKSWLTMSSIGGSNPLSVTFKATPNEGGDRSAKVVFETIGPDDGKTYTSEVTFTQKGAIVAATVAEFNAAEVGGNYRITAMVSSIYNAAKGRFYIKDWSGETYVYNYSNFEATGVKEGDIITIVGKRDQYKETIEMTSATIEEIKPVTPVSIPEFLAKEDSNDVYYMVSGTLTKIDNPTYGNVYLSDGTNELYVYGCYPGYGATGDNRKNFLATAGIEVGDELTVIGVKSTYNGTSQVKNGFYFSHKKAGAE